MSIARMTAVWKLSQEKGSGLLVLLSLADRADDDGYCWPGMEDTAKRAKVSRRYVLTVIERAIENKELFVNKRPGYTHEYIVPHGMNFDELTDALRHRFALSDDEISDLIGQSLWCEQSSHVNHSSQGGCEPQFTGGVNHSSHESSLGIIDEASLTPIPNFSIISGAVVTATKIPEPSAGGRGWTDWEDGVNQLLKIKVTSEEIQHAVNLLDEKGYSYTGPGSLTKTIINIRKKQERKNEAQRVGGQIVE